MDTKYFIDQLERLYADSIWLSNKIAELYKQLCSPWSGEATELLADSYKKYLEFQLDLFDTIEQLRSEKK